MVKDKNNTSPMFLPKIATRNELPQRRPISPTRARRGWAAARARGKKRSGLCYAMRMGMIHHLVFVLVAVLFTLFAWLGGGVVAKWLAPWAPWLTLLLAECALVLPEQRPGEALDAARVRVWRGIVRDPLTWVAAALMLFLTLQWLNACLCLEWNAAAQQWRVVSPAFEWLYPANLGQWLAVRPEAPQEAAAWPVLGTQPVKWLPWSLRADEARGVLNWFGPVLAAVLAVRHALGRRSKRGLAAFICLMSAVLAIAGIVQFAVGGEFLYWGMKSRAFFFATFGYPNHAAGYFAAVMAVSMGCGLWAMEHREEARLPAWLFFGAAGLCAAGAVLSGSRAGMLFALGIAAFCALFIPLRYAGSWPRARRFGVLAALAVGALAVFGTAAFRIHAATANAARARGLRHAFSLEARHAALKLPEYHTTPALDTVFLELAETPWADYLAHPMLMRSGYQGILALRQAAAYPWFGTGAWSFRWLNAHFIRPDSPEEQEWLKARLSVGQANVHNDTLQFLAEHGWVGFGLMLACVALLLGPFLRLLWVSPARVASDVQADRCWVNRLNVWLIFALLATTLLAAHSFIDLVFRSPACMLLYGLLFVCAEGFVPRARPLQPKTEGSAHA